MQGDKETNLNNRDYESMDSEEISLDKNQSSNYENILMGNYDTEDDDTAAANGAGAGAADTDVCGCCSGCGCC